MDFLFLNHNASIEALIVFLSLGVIFLSFLYDAFIWARIRFRELNPRKVHNDTNTVKTDAPLDETLSVSESDVEGNSSEKISIPSTGNSEQDVNPDAVPLMGEEDKEKMLSNSESVGREEPTSTEVKIDDSDIADSIKTTTIGEQELSIGSEEVEKTDSEMNNTSIIDDIEEGQTGIKPEETGGIDAGETNQDKVIDSIEPSVQVVPDDAGVDYEKKKKEQGNEEKVQHASFEGEGKEKEKPIRRDKMDKLVEIVNNVKTLIARGHIDDARALIVNGLSLKKDHRELNMLMANLYEREHAFEKAEFILKELAEHDPEDAEVLLHLATVVAMQKKFEVAYELYKKVISIQGESEETLYTLTHIASELSLPEDVYSFAKSYLKQYPKNPEILWLYSQSQIARSDRRGAIETLIKLKNLTPYNQEIVDLISKLVTEDELAGNFGENSEK